MKMENIKKLLKKNEAFSFILAILLFLILCITSPYFLRVSNFESLQTSIAPYGIMAIGMMLLIILGAFDMSVGSVMCLGGLITAVSLDAGMSVPVAIILGILSGTIVGFINGLLVEIAKINPLITTIGTMYITRGICEITLVGKGQAGFANFPEMFLKIGAGKFLGVYYMMWIMLALVILSQYYLRNRPGGRKFYFIGGNDHASSLMGINVMKTKIQAFVLSGTFAALAGVLATARSGTANRYMGQNAHMDIIIACIIGGGSLNGGKGSIVGGIFGTVFMVLMSNSFNLFEIPPQWRNITVGAILLAVVVVDGYVILSKNKRNGKI